MSRDNRIVVGTALTAACLLSGACAQHAVHAREGTGAYADLPGRNLPSGHLDVRDTTREPPLVGVVTETLNGGSYTYAELNVEGKEVWTAGPTTRLVPGDSVSVSTSLPMQDFRSRALGRMFGRIYFTSTFLKPGTLVPVGARGSSGTS